VLLDNLLAALNFANGFLNKKTFGKLKKNVKKRDQNKKNVKTFFYIYDLLYVTQTYTVSSAGSAQYSTRL